MKPRHGMALLFVVTAVASGLTFWWQHDWWYYVATGPEEEVWPKFKAPAWEQFVVSAPTTALFGGASVGAASLVRALGSRLTNRCSPSPRRLPKGKDVLP